MSWGEVALSWLPAGMATAIWAFGIVAVATQPSRPAKRYWLAAFLLAGAAAVGASVWHRHSSHLGQMVELQATASRAASLQANVTELTAKVGELEGQLDTLRQQSRRRTIDPDSAAQIADALRQAGSHRVVVSCAPDDVEAYGYANQIANVLRAAGWEALGPEATSIFGEGAAMGVRLYVRSGTAPPETAKILIDAFTRFNIPFESGITPSEAIPDPATTEVFVSRKP